MVIRASEAFSDLIPIISAEGIASGIKTDAVYSSIAEMTASGFSPSDGFRAVAYGYRVAGDGGEGRFTWDSNDRSADVDNGIVFPMDGDDGSNGAFVRLLGDHITPEMFGFEVGLDAAASSNDARFQAALDYMAVVPYMRLNNATYRVGTQLNLTTSEDHKSFLIQGSHGTRIVAQAGASITIFKRIPADHDQAVTMASYAFHIKDIEFRGDGTTSQTGVYLGASYMSTIENCHFRRLGTGLDLVFALNANVSSCWATQCKVTSFSIRSGRLDWSGAGLAAQSNHTSLYKCRVFGDATATSQLFISEANGVYVENCIFEGAGGTNLVYWDRGTTTTAKQFTMRNTHFETTATDSLAKFVNCQSQTFLFENVRSQQDDQIQLDVEGSTSRVLVLGMAQLPSGAKLRSSSTHNWYFLGAVEDMADSNKWDTGAPRVLSLYREDVGNPDSKIKVAGVARYESSDATRINAGAEIFLDATDQIELTTSYLELNGGAQIEYVLKASQLWDPGTIAAGQAVTTNVAVPDMNGGNWNIVVQHTQINSETLMMSANKNGDEQATVIVFNPTASPISPGSGTLNVLAISAN